MKFATPYENGEICQHFGRAPQFKIFEVTPQGVQEAVIVDTQGSGHAAISEFLAAQGVQAVLCGGIGHGALVALAQLGIDVVPGVSGNPDEAIQQLIDGTLQPAEMGCGCGGHGHHEHGEGGCGCGGHGHHEHGEGGCGCGGHGHGEGHEAGGCCCGHH
ncbi:NifB/NifX family molybdenum-iron cluster-binding protein [uncultured Parasutterella sp.]|uniref:NifB/NifX family molybdenum-iron cluster-binding protein n=1 Tax=uncultured Parasutterella sp. TaxID=1263098 RepID=UPI002593C1BE|nr:NifB/NifX family molybdenum-iron cluster-binding protein [uncultured Parasutterella sp.]